VDILNLRNQRHKIKSGFIKKEILVVPVKRSLIEEDQMIDISMLMVFTNTLWCFANNFYFMFMDRFYKKVLKG